MPKYKYVGSLPMLAIDNMELHPGKVFDTIKWYTRKDFEKVDDKPVYNPILVSKIIKKDDVIEIPAVNNRGKDVNRYQIHICVIKGFPVIFYNSEDNEPGLSAYPSMKWNVRSYGEIRRLHITKMSENDEVVVIVEELL